MDVVRAVATLRASGYRGFLNVEYEEEEDPMTGVPALVEAVRGALAAR